MSIMGIFTGIIIGIASNAIANIITLGSIQPVNIAVGLVIGGALGFFMR